MLDLPVRNYNSCFIPKKSKINQKPKLIYMNIITENIITENSTLFFLFFFVLFCFQSDPFHETGLVQKINIYKWLLVSNYYDRLTKKVEWDLFLCKTCQEHKTTPY